MSSSLELCRLPSLGDFLVCGVSTRTQLHQRVAGFDEAIASDDKEFAASGLKVASLIRLGFLAVLPDSALLRKTARPRQFEIVSAPAILVYTVPSSNDTKKP